jgi:hypothetical protein
MGLRSLTHESAFLNTIFRTVGSQNSIAGVSQGTFLTNPDLFAWQFLRLRRCRCGFLVGY